MIAIGIIKKSSAGGSGNVFGQFQSFSKGIVNCILNTGSELEAGDIVNKGFKDLNTWWEAAIYNGGDINDRANYTPLLQIDLETNCAVDLENGNPLPFTAHYSNAHYSTDYSI